LPFKLKILTGLIYAHIHNAQVRDYYDEYNTLERGKGAVLGRKEKVAQLVDKFYSLVTDLYEWGWGTSFHFSPLLPGKDWPACESAHEGRIAALTGLEPGKVALDVGCGVGGPMRTIAAVSGGKVTGITINEYQVNRAAYHNEKLGLTDQCTAVRGNFLSMPFEDATFDAAYAIEATCHAPTLEDVYKEVFRCLKPGSLFVTYEWVTTPEYDPKNKAHVAIADEIIIGNGLPKLNSWKEAEEAGKNVGFKVLQSRNLAIKPDGTLTPWWTRLSPSLDRFKAKANINHALVSVAEFLRIAPSGMVKVHQMLVDTGIALIEGGEQGLFTPMHMLVFKKP
jgi:24-methylenesterol C-methyltransferase